ncbi:MAG: hypothetical protein JWP97_4517 [Labilithrix sp.]|nr:hypothetical protein [Labilithrix sp.]
MASAARILALTLSTVTLGGILASCTATANLSDIYTALDGNGDRQRDTFYTDSKEIHCVIEAGIGRRGVTIESLIRQLQGYDFSADRFFDTDRVAANVEVAPTPQDGVQKVDLVLSPSAPDGSAADDAPFLPGHFICEAYLDGKLERSAVFNVVFPPCPASSILPTTVCYGFYKANTECPRYGLTSDDPARCVCDPVKGWQCP